MAMTVSGMNTSSLNTLFSGLNQSGGMTSYLSDYNSIKSGSYGKLLNAYYGQTGVTGGSSQAKSTGSVDHTSRGYREQYVRAQEQKANSTSGSNYLDKTQKEKAKTNQQIATASNEMVGALDKLRNSDTFKKNAKGEYDTASIQSAVQSYVDAYNDVMKTSKDSPVSGVTTNVSSIKTTTQTSAKALSEVGISIGSDGKMSLNEETFKKADMGAVKSLFDKGNYGYSVRTAAYMTNYYAKQAQSTTTTYGANGSNSLSDLMSSYSGYI